MKLSHPNSDQVINVSADVADRYLDQGWRVAEPGAPAGKASLKAWQAFAISRGFTEDDIRGKTKAELRAAAAALP